MTIVVPSFIASVYSMVIVFLFIVFYSIVLSRLSKKKDINPNDRWVAVLGVILCLGVYILLEFQVQTLYPQDFDIVIDGKGEVVEVANRNHHLLTTDDDLFLFGSFPYGGNTAYELETKDNEHYLVRLDVETASEPTIETIVALREQYMAEMDDFTDYSSRYFSGARYFGDLLEKKIEDWLRIEVGMCEAEEITEELLIGIIGNFVASMSEVEKEMFTLKLAR